METQVKTSKDGTASAVVRVVPSELLGFGRKARLWQRSTPFAYHIEFNGVGDMVRLATEGASRSDLYSFDFFSDPVWIGREFKTFAEIVKATDTVWTHGVDRVEEMSRELEREELPKPTVIKRRRVWDEAAGDEIDFDRYRAADPYFRDTTRTRTNGPRVITIIIQLGQNAWMDSDALFWRGALAITLARIVEDAGYRTEIIAFTAGEGTTTNPNVGNVLSSVRLKEAGDTLDLPSLVNVTSGWFFRTVTFASWTVPGEVLSFGLGSMVEATPEMVEFLAPGARPWVVSGVYDKETSLKLARELLATLVTL